MWRNLITAFNRTVVLTPKQLSISRAKWKFHPSKVSINHHRSLVSSSVLQNTEAAVVRAGSREGDAEYIVPYKTEYETRDVAETLVETLRTRFHLSPEDVERVMKDGVVSKMYRKKSLMLTLETLLMEGVTKNNFVEYPWVITLEKGRLADKIFTLKSLSGFRDINDFVPFLRLQLPRLKKLVANLNKESKQFNGSNRVYYIAEQLEVPASMVTKFLTKRLFVLEMPLEMFKTNLQHLLDYKVESMNILKDLWAFKYTPRAVETRLKRAMSAKKDKIMPWMVRCPEPILQKSLQLSLDELEVLGSKTTVAEYIAERLGFTAEEAKGIMNRHPQVNTVRVTKIKDVLDYLLDEAQFTRHEIAQVPRILCHKLETTKQRIDELKSYGCRPSSLVIVCKSKREYMKFLDSWLKIYNPNKTVNKIEEIKDGAQS